MESVACEVFWHGGKEGPFKECPGCRAKHPDGIRETAKPMPKVARTVPSAFLLSNVQEVEGEAVLIADCLDYDAFMALPKVLRFRGQVFGLTGWNSDKHYACWKVSHLVASRG